MKEKIKQFLCGLFGHGSASSVVNHGDTGGYHRYCPDCKKTLALSMSEGLSERDVDFLLKKL